MGITGKIAKNEGADGPFVFMVHGVVGLFSTVNTKKNERGQSKLTTTGTT
jgi:hypothetical protein